MKLNKLIIFALSIFFISSIPACSQNNSEEKDSVALSDTIIKVIKKEYKPELDTISIIGVGDMMLGTNFPTSPNYLPPNNDCKPLIAPVVHILRDADLTFGNNEGVYSDKPELARPCNDPRWCYRFSMPEKYVNCLVDAGFDVVSIGNNHLGDLGAYGRKNTVKVLSEAGLHFAGLTTHPTDTFTLNNIKYGFCAFAPNDGTCQITDYELLKRTVKKLKEDCQIVIVSFHGGAEGSKHEHLTRKTEVFLGQNRGNVYKFAHTAIDAGADIVFGHGPHVTRAVEVYKKRFIAYSMGNFITYRRFNINGVSGLSPIIKVYINGKGEFIKGKITATYQNKMTGTKLDPNNRVITRMQQLIKQDIPESIIEIKNNGDIVYKN
ncbi:MAG: CapA family protein [Bacteroidales bacterium]|nr:CapA family protein [Bacteroidales bacterium]